MAIVAITAGISWAQVASGESAPDFTLQGVRGGSHTLSDQKGAFVVLEWTNYDCPFVRKHYNSGNMQAMQKEYTARGVQWFSVSSSAPGRQGHLDSRGWRKRMADFRASPTAMLLDADGEVGKTYGAKTTPHMFVIDPEGILIYHGAVDSIPSTDPADVPKAKNFVRQALEEAMGGEEVSEPSSWSYGCSVKY